MKSQAKTTLAPPSDSAAPVMAKSAARKPAKKSPTKNSGTSGKLGKVVALLKRPKGATITELMKATGWQAHSVRGAISGAVKKKLKHTVLSEKAGAVRSYRIRS